MTLDALNPFDIYDTEAQRLDRFFGSLDDAGWRRPSRCAGWVVRDVLAHLAGQEAYNHACLDGTVDELVGALTAAGGLDDFNERTVRQRRVLPASQVLAEWRTANRQTRQRMRERGREATLQTAAGPYPVGSQTFHYASELATHADDVGAPVDPAEEPGRTAWRAEVGRHVLAEQDRPVQLTPTDDGFEVTLTGDEAEQPTAKLSTVDFVAATVARLPDRHPLDRRLRQALACLV